MELSPVVELRRATWPWEALEDLEAQELRLYALGWGDHLPVEVRERIEALHRRRVELEAQLADW
ncbi:MAG: hypothetical protein WAL63_04860 [Solirubrobacteraceae bacterium]